MVKKNSLAIRSLRSGLNQRRMLLSVLYHLQCFLDPDPDDVEGMVLIPIVLVSEQTKVVVNYRKVYDAMRFLWNDLLVNATDEFDVVRHEPGCEVRIPCLAIPSVVQIDSPYPVIGELRF